MSERTWERITAADVRCGDLIARTRTADPEEVIEIPAKPGGYITLRFGAGRNRIRPRATAKLWRLV